MRREPSGLRHLMVIDMNDTDAVKRLAAAWDAADYATAGPVPMTMTEMRMLAALREFADPKRPKPDEPTGLGAVVEDAAGKVWIRCNGEQAAWAFGGPFAGPVRWNDYADIDAVKVLSEGVTP